MMKEKKLLIVICLLFILGLNFYLFRSEFKVIVDPNDNIFQYALVDEAKNIWKQIFSGKLSPMYLLDSWNERWADGFALSSSYAHLPQAVMSLMGFISPIGMHKTFVVIRTLMLIFLPLMFFLAGTILRLPMGFNLILSFLSQVIFTNGLYGIDLSSFVWRGWGLSAQLMALFFLPVAFAYSIDYLSDETHRTHGKLAKAVLFNFLVAQNHMGMFLLLLMTYPIFYVANFLYIFLFTENIKYQISKIIGNWKLEIGNFKKLFIFLGFTLFSLSYFIVPFFLQGKYRNFSYWDPIWKFDSWGAKQIIIWFLNGEMFDFNRFPVITLGVFGGVLAGLGAFWGTLREKKIMFYFSLLFLFFTVLFLGRTTLGSLIDLLPGFSEYHLHRIIVMVQFFGLFSSAWFIYSILKWLDARFFSPIGVLVARQEKPSFTPAHLLSRKKASIFAMLLVLVGIVIFYFLERPLFAYMKDNAMWIDRANKAYQYDLPNYEKLTSKLSSLPSARVYAGKPGNWGKNLTVGETPLYMALSRDGFPVIGFLPESWSPNSDQEQFFDENKLIFYHLYHVGFLVLPQNHPAPDFAKLELGVGKFNLYSVKTDGWFTAGRNSIDIRANKTDLLNVTRLWFMSKLMYKDYPSIDLDNKGSDGKRWKIAMNDLNTFVNLNDEKERSIWTANPFNGFTRTYPDVKIQKINEEKLTNGYKANLKVSDDCQNCVVVLKQSYHPNWSVKINGEDAAKIPVFPFFIGIPISRAGNYEIEVIYRPNSLKVFLVLAEVGLFGYVIAKSMKNMIR